ncbi:amidase signature domain-containing protein [Boeremia exigua]|uniref:amidase signature domain-containing protein n=1 Tax=Boeremia exigua TaxID=749465 RepID=UPI001E8CC5FC|nr:amidase signature domain-containing protein [Boeremia exigua]KAH6639193.1 amidase signature domain-containing protein [Boeremia exigua]
MGLLEYRQHKADCQRKQHERATKIANLPATYSSPLTSQERTILGKPIQDLVQEVQNNVTNPIDVLRTYSKVTLKAHEKTNCATEILFPEAEEWATKECNLKGPLAGIPVSLKDSIQVKGFDITVGFSTHTGKPYAEDGPMVRLLKDAGAVPFVKTNLPTTLLSFESTNDVWGRSKNPHNTDYSPGGSTGGESALLAFGGSRIGIGSDVAGSVRVPAHFSGCYSIRCSTGRWPKIGMNTAMPGQEAIPSVFSPMARTLNDLTYFTRSLIQCKPWEYDYTVHPLAWQQSVEDEYRDKKVLRVGVLRTDGVVDPSPACARALSLVVDALRAEGHEVFDVSPPSPYEALKLASHLLLSDGGQTFMSFFRTGEWNDPGASVMVKYMNLPRFVKKLHYWWVKYVRRDEIWAGLIKDWSPKSAHEYWQLAGNRESYKAKFFDWWDTQGKGEKAMDVMLAPPNATPAVPHGGMHDAVSSCGYTFLFNLLDYSAGVIPVTHVDPAKDALPATFNFKKLNGIAQGAYKHYDAVKMAGLPVGIQVIGRRLQEEKVLAIMERCEDALDKHGGRYELLEID